MRRAVGSLALLGLLLGCGDGVIQRVGDPRAPLATRQPGRYMQIIATPPEVEVYIDGAYRGRLDGYRGGVLRLSPRARRARLSRPGFEDWYGLIPPGDRVKITAALIRKIP